MSDPETTSMGWRFRLHEIIFEADTPAGKAFDVVLLLAIIASIAAVMLESVAGLRRDHGADLRVAEWVFTVLFTAEYLVRIATVGKPLRYMTSFFGLVDLLAIAPTYLSLILPGTQSFIVIRALRLLRVFRVLKFARFVGEERILMTAMRASSRKIAVFLMTLSTVVLVIGALMYLVEGERGGYTSIPKAVYWAIVTMTTVGYGDIIPQTTVGKFFASIIMIIGYGIIAVPTGIVSVELAQAARRPVSTQACQQCSREGHDTDASHCKYCGAAL